MGRSKIRTGKFQTKHGYIKVYLEPSDPFFSMAEANNYAYEHRLVMARHLGRYLSSEEFVHHKNGIKIDNRLENLELIGSLGRHSKSHSEGYQAGFEQGYSDGMAKRIKEVALQ